MALVEEIQLFITNRQNALLKKGYLLHPTMEGFLSIIFTLVQASLQKGTIQRHSGTLRTGSQNDQCNDWQSFFSHLCIKIRFSLSLKISRFPHDIFFYKYKSAWTKQKTPKQPTNRTKRKLKNQLRLTQEIKDHKILQATESKQAIFLKKEFI